MANLGVALLAEELVEEWLNRQGYFTIRGAKLGNDEMDLLAVRHKDGDVDCRHIEVQVAIKPIGYVSKLTKEDQQATGKGANSPGPRSMEEYSRAIDAWVEKKFGQEKKKTMLQTLVPGPWTREFVVNKVRYPEELDHLRQRGISVLRLEDVLRDLARPSTPILQAGGGDLVNLLWIGKISAPESPSLDATNSSEESEI